MVDLLGVVVRRCPGLTSETPPLPGGDPWPAFSSASYSPPRRSWLPAAAGGGTSGAVEQVSYRIARDRPEDPVRLELLDGQRVVYEYTPDGSVMFLIEVESV